MTAFIWKWLVCSWAHSKSRCYPTVWGPEQAKEMGVPYRPNSWHCTYCHPCGEEIQKMLDEQGRVNCQSKWDQEHPMAAIVEKHLLGVAPVHARLKLVRDLEEHFSQLGNEAKP